MKKIKIVFLLSVLCCFNGAVASDCIGPECNIDTQTDILTPKMPDDNLWIMTTQTNSGVCSIDINCPFDTESECDIWRTKPMVNEIVSPRSPKIPDIDILLISSYLRYNEKTSANDSDILIPLMERYAMLLRASNACCSSGFVYKLHKADYTDNKIYNLIVKDINNADMTNRCLVTSDKWLQNKYNGSISAKDIKSVRDTCLCKSRQWFEYLLAPFVELYNIVPDFKTNPFYYTYKDGLNRMKTISVNADVQNVLIRLNQCL